MISLSITDKNFVNQIDEGNRFPHQICVSHHRVHPITYNNVSNLYNNSVVEKTNGMTFNPTTTLKLIN
jgi:hypothetical protein